MSFDFSTLITDRTYADVSRVQDLASKIRSGTASESELAEFNGAAMKGAYNHTDLNRVTAAMESLKAKLEGYGYAVPGYQRIKVPHALPEPEPTSRLPEGYLELTHIEATGTQYIDTKFSPNQDTRVVCKAQYTNISGSYCLFGARYSVNERRYDFLVTGGRFYSEYNNNSGSYPTLSATTDVLEIDKNKNVTTVNGVTHSSHNYVAFQAPCNMLLFAENTNNSPHLQAKAKIYYFQIYDNGVLVRDFVPCTNSTGTAGLYDTVNGVFYQNAGSGAFAAGEEIVAPATASVMVTSGNADEYDPYTWYEFDWPTPETMTVYLLNVVALRSVFAVMKSTPSVPKDAVGLMVQEANDIEKILVDINELLMKSTQVWFYSGELFAGEV